jgi:hypothetical protein
MRVDIAKMASIIANPLPMVSAVSCGMAESKNFIGSEKMERKYGDSPVASIISADGSAQTRPSMVDVLKDCLLHLMVETVSDRINPKILSIP